MKRTIIGGMGIGCMGLVLLGVTAGCQHKQTKVHDMPTNSAPPSVVRAQQNQDLNQKTQPAETMQRDGLLQGNREVLGTVDSITSQQIKVDIGEMQPRYLPLKPSKEKSFETIKPGDHLLIVLSDQNLIVDYHLLDTAHEDHRIIQGQIAQNLAIGHERAVVRQPDGKQESFEIRPSARSKIASLPVGSDALFLVDESNKIVDATYANVDAAKRASQHPEEKSPIKGAHRQVDGVVVGPLQAGLLTVRTKDNIERPYEIRSLITDKVEKLEKGQSVILMVDTDGKVMDISLPE